MLLAILGFLGFFNFKDCIGYIWFMFFSFFAFFTWGIIYRGKKDERFLINKLKAQRVSLALAFVVLILLIKEMGMEKTPNELMILLSSLAFSFIINIEPFIFLFYERKFGE